MVQGGWGKARILGSRPGSDGPGSSGSLPLASSLHLTAGGRVCLHWLSALRANGRYQARKVSRSKTPGTTHK